MKGAAGVIIVSCFLLAAILAPLITSHDPLAQNLPDRRAPPSWQEGGTLNHPLGTDYLGRDVWSRLVYGARSTLIFAAGALAIGGGLGTALGFASGYWRGTRDRIFDVSLPRLISPAVWLVCCVLIAIILLATVGPGLIGLTIVIGLVTWLRYVKPIRREVMRPDMPRHHSPVDGEGGTADFRPTFRRLLPRVVGALPALLISQMGFLILLESIITFLGVGVAPPDPSWGGMLSDTRNLVPASLWSWAPALLFILLLAGGFYMLGDWLYTRARNSRAAS